MKALAETFNECVFLENLYLLYYMGARMVQKYPLLIKVHLY